MESSGYAAGRGRRHWDGAQDPRNPPFEYDVSTRSRFRRRAPHEFSAKPVAADFRPNGGRL